VTERGTLSAEDEQLLQLVAEGRPIKAIAVAQKTTPAAVAAAIDRLFLKLARDASGGVKSSLKQLKALHQAIVDREEQGESLSRLLPTGVARRLRSDSHAFEQPEKLLVTILMSDVRGYSAIAERSEPAVLCTQLNEHRAAMNRAILDRGGTVMQFVGDAVMAVFGAPQPQPDHAQSALASAQAMHAGQLELNERWAMKGLPGFGLGIGLSTGEVAAALLGSDERVEYSVVGDVVNLTQRLQQFAAPGQTVLTEATHAAIADPPPARRLDPTLVKGRLTPVVAYVVG
jgi:class 3 adenylate cyclase